MKFIRCLYNQARQTDRQENKIKKNRPQVILEGFKVHSLVGH